MSTRHVAKHQQVIPELKDCLCPDDAELADLPPDQVAFRLTLDIGMPGEEASNSFYALVTTPQALRSDAGRQARPRERDRPPPIVVEPPSRWEAVEAEIQRRLAACADTSWEHICDKLRRQFSWEYESYRG